MRKIISYILIKGNEPAFKMMQTSNQNCNCQYFSYQGKSLGTCHHYLSICIVFILVLPV